jgi:DNA-binding LacI/PurR family transcriptional regulator
MAQGRIKRPGRVAARLAEELKSRIAAGRVRVGEYLPGARELGREHRVSPETARRAMKIMEAERWVRAYPGHGFKVTARGNDPERAAPVGFVLSGKLGGGRWTSLCQLLVGAVQRAAEDRGWSTLNLGATGRSAGSIVEELSAARVAGLLLDTPDRPLVAALGELGIPTVLVEEQAAGLDSVSQDNFGGALLAGEYLLARGHRRLAWFGAMAPTVHSRERWAGARAAVRDSGAVMASLGSTEAEVGECEERFRRLLSGAERPTGILALWWTAAVTAARVAGQLGLRPGADIEIVSWCPREQLAEFSAAWPLGGSGLPPTVTWSMRQLGDAALSRLAERRRRPDAPPVRVSVGVELMSAERLREGGVA